MIHEVSTTLPSLYFPLLHVPLTVFLTGAHACAGVSCCHVKLKARVIHRRSLSWLLTRKPGCAELTDSYRAVLDCGLVSSWINLKKMNGAFISLARTVHHRLHWLWFQFLFGCTNTQLGRFSGACLLRGVQLFPLNTDVSASLVASQNSLQFDESSSFLTLSGNKCELN